MNTSQQLFRLQELDLEIETTHRDLNNLMAKLGDDSTLAKLRMAMAEKNKELEEMKKLLRSLETEADDMTVKLTASENDLYAGHIKNPKELSSLQREIEMLKGKREALDDKQLALMEQIESLEAEISVQKEQLKEREAEWQEEQHKLAEEINRLKDILSKLEQEYQKTVSGIDRSIILLYGELKQKRKTAVARAVQGVCSGCRLQLPATDLQRLRSGNIVQCSSCGRILYLA